MKFLHPSVLQLSVLSLSGRGRNIRPKNPKKRPKIEYQTFIIRPVIPENVRKFTHGRFQNNPK